MKTLITAIVLLALPLGARAQAVINMPDSQGEEGAVIFSSFTLTVEAGQGITGVLEDHSALQAPGKLHCERGILHADARFAHGDEEGDFAFPQVSVCSDVALAMIKHPGLHVKFSVALDPFASGSVVIGRVTKVEWLDTLK